MLSYYVIYYEKFRNVMQRAEKEALTVCTVCMISKVLLVMIAL